LYSEKFIVTIRDRAETIGLVKSFGIQGEVVGKYYRDNIKKSLFMINRTIKLNSKINKFDVALSFENGMSVALSKFRKKKSILFCDNDLKFIKKESFIQNLETKIKTFADIIITPAASQENFEKKIKKGNIISYNGYKEDVYLADFKPDSNFMEKIPYDNFVALRPEALESFYVKEKKSIVPDLLHSFEKENINVVYLPREKEDADYAKGFDVYIPDETLNGLDLVYYSDAVLTGSGTMAREAACMDKTAVSFFPGENLLAVDSQLVSDRKMFHSRDVNDIIEFVISKNRRENISNFQRSKIVKKEVIKLIKKYLDE
jgi:predicted glycosyltransferase